MKITCKQCGKKQHIKKAGEVECDETNCEIKYDMRGQVFSFDGFKVSDREPEYISVFVTAPPTRTVELTVEEWQTLMEEQGVFGPAGIDHGNAGPPF